MAAEAFPSGHSTAAMALALCLVLLRPPACGPWPRWWARASPSASAFSDHRARLALPQRRRGRLPPRLGLGAGPDGRALLPRPAPPRPVGPDEGQGRGADGHRGPHRGRAWSRSPRPGRPCCAGGALAVAAQPGGLMDIAERHTGLVVVAPAVALAALALLSGVALPQPRAADRRGMTGLVHTAGGPGKSGESPARSRHCDRVTKAPHDCGQPLGGHRPPGRRGALSPEARRPVSGRVTSIPRRKGRPCPIARSLAAARSPGPRARCLGARRPGRAPCPSSCAWRARPAPSTRSR